MGYLQVIVMLLGEEKKHAPCQEIVEVLVLYIPCYSHNPETKTMDIATHLRVPGTAIISTLHRPILSSQNPNEIDIFIISHFTKEETGPEKLSNMPEVT